MLIFIIGRVLAVGGVVGQGQRVGGGQDAQLGIVLGTILQERVELIPNAVALVAAVAEGVFNAQMGVLVECVGISWGNAGVEGVSG